MKERFDDYNEKIMEKLEQKVREIEEELEENPELEGVHADASLDRKVYGSIEKYEAVKSLSETDKEALRLGRELQMRRRAEEEEKNPSRKESIKRFPGMWKRVAVVLGVVLITASVGIQSMGGPERVVEMVKHAVGGREVSKINSSTGEVKSMENEEELKAYQEIKDVLGIHAVRVIKMPGKMKYQYCEVNKELRTAFMIYEFEGHTVSYIMNCVYAEDKWGIDIEDKEIEEYSYDVGGVDVTVTEYELPESKERKYCAEFEYEGVYYQLTGTMERQEFEEILDYLHFS